MINYYAYLFTVCCASLNLIIFMDFNVELE